MSFACARLGATAHMILFLSFAIFVQAYDCSITTVQLGITNTPLDNGVPVNRGLQVKFPGNQILGLRLSTAYNNTFISNSNNCHSANSTEDNACEGAVGSTFDPVPNVGWTPYLESDWEALVGHVDNPPANTNVVKGVANVDFDDGPTIDIPVEVWSNPGIDPVTQVGSPPSRSVFGIGPSSDLTRSLLNQSFVPSGYMGIYFGSRSLNCSEDGKMTIGGWDSSRVGGAFVNYTLNAMPMNATCPLRVWVKAMNLNNDEGSHPLISDGQSIPACVDPFQNAVGLTDALYNVWANITQHPTQPDGPPFTDKTYPLANEHLIGTLDIELEGGYGTTISHCELVSLERGANLDDVGEYTVVNNSRIMASVSHGPTDLGDNFGILLGGAFLATTYLRIDYENNQFSLAPSVAGLNIAPNIQKVCSKDTGVPTKTNDTMTASTSAPSSSRNNGGGLSIDAKAAIAGSVVGGVIALVGVWIGWKTYRHARQSEDARQRIDNERLEIERARTMSTVIGASPLSRPSEATSPKTKLSEGGKPRIVSVELPQPALEGPPPR